MEKYLINPNQRIATINKDIYGHFSEHLGRCIYDGIFVGKDSKIPNVNGMRTDVVTALKDMGIPVLRWPGGCFADEYHWTDGIGEQKDRKKMINTNWGGVVEDNSFGTHEYFELIRQLGCDAYVNGNVGSGSVREMNEWVEYMTFDGVSPMADLRKKNGADKPWKLRYFGVGNESWGCGGHMNGDYYADEFRRYNTYVRDYTAGEHIYRVACGPNAFDFKWTEQVMRKVPDQADGLSLHYYTVPYNWDHKGSATAFNLKDYNRTVAKAYRMEELVRRHTEIMNALDPQKRVDLIVDEWGTWFDVEPGTNPGFLYQLNTMRDAMVAALTLNIFNKHADRVQMANIAQTVNVLQAVILTEGDKMVLTPTYHVFKMYKDHQQNTLIGSYLTNSNTVECEECSAPQMIESASVDENGTIYATVTNISATKKAKIKCQIADTKVSTLRAEILTGDMHDKNDFSNPDAVQVRPFDGVRKLSDGFVAELPPCSVVKFVINEK